MVFRKGFANSMKQARQFIVHGHIAVNGRKTTIPSYMVLKAEEEALSYYVGSTITKEKLAAKPVPVAPAAKARPEGTRTGSSAGSPGRTGRDPGSPQAPKEE